MFHVKLVDRVVVKQHMQHINSFDKLNSCLLDVHEWMLSCILKLNHEKTELIMFGHMLNSRN